MTCTDTSAESGTREPEKSPRGRAHDGRTRYSPTHVIAGDRPKSCCPASLDTIRHAQVPTLNQRVRGPRPDRAPAPAFNLGSGPTMAPTICSWSKSGAQRRSQRRSTPSNHSQRQSTAPADQQILHKCRSERRAHLTGSEGVRGSSPLSSTVTKHRPPDLKVQVGRFFRFAEAGCSPGTASTTTATS
jgi:hypothetical protein